MTKVADVHRVLQSNWNYETIELSKSSKLSFSIEIIGFSDSTSSVGGTAGKIYQAHELLSLSPNPQTPKKLVV